MQFIYCTWAFNKNYERILNQDQDVISDESAQEEDQSVDEESGIPKALDKSKRYRTYTFE
mgnify:CR=1 FL=1